MLSRWRKQAREGLIQTEGVELDRAVRAERQELRQVKKAYEQLRVAHELLLFCVAGEGGDLAMSRENIVPLTSGRSLGYAEYGDPQGIPVLHFHGLPSSRFELHRPALETIATELGVRILVVERPGIGLSAFQTYTISRWPELIVEFADRLHLDRFGVMGVSGGGKYVLACAWKIPERIRGAVVVSGTCPFHLPGARESLTRQDRLIYALSDRTPSLFRLLLGKVASDVRRRPESVLKLFPELAGPDKATLALPDMQQVLRQTLGAAFSQGTRGVALDWRLEARPWGFALDEIHLPVHLFHGEQDRIVSVAQARILENMLPQVRARYYGQEGHLSVVAHHFNEILRSAAGMELGRSD